MRTESSARSKGLVMYSSAPSSKPCFFSSAERKRPVIMMRMVVLERLRSSWQIWKPEESGSWMSMITTSGLSLAAASMPGWAAPAWWHSNPSSSRTSARLSRRCASSSMIRSLGSLFEADILPPHFRAGRYQLVSHAGDRRDEAGGGAQLLAQAPDVDVDGARRAEIIVAPDALDEIRPAEDPIGRAQEDVEQVELL